ncbi:MAG TPA: copper amine oxidase N-terminal domain-containing protein [Bacillota bacterium]|nr:copper amine oxidase N-terminal domain-containing protein [Bacillota bacterium]
MRHWKRVVIGTMLGATTLTGCESVQNVNLNQVLTNSAELKSYEMQSSGKLHLDINSSQPLDPDARQVVDLFNNMKFTIHGIMQDDEHISLDGVIELSKGSIPYEFTVSGQEVKIRLDGAVKPILMKIPDGNQAQSKELTRKLISAIVKDLPNPKNLSVGVQNETVHGSDVKGISIKTEIKSSEIIDLLKKFVNNLQADTEGVKQLVAFMNEVQRQQIQNTGAGEFHALTENEFKAGLLMVQDGLNKQTIPTIPDNNKLGMEIFVDSNLQFRKSKTQLEVTLPVPTPVQGFQIETADEYWNLNQGLQMKQMDTADSITLDENTSPYDFLDSLNKDGILYKNISEKMKDMSWMRLQVGSNEALVKGGKTELDAAPIVENGSTLVPARFIAEGLNADVQWNPDDQSVTITDQGKQIVLYVGQDTAYVNGEPVTLSTPATVNEDRLYVPLRFTSEQLNATINYNNKNQTITITRQ